MLFYVLFSKGDFNLFSFLINIVLKLNHTGLQSTQMWSLKPKKDRRERPQITPNIKMS